MDLLFGDDGALCESAGTGPEADRERVETVVVLSRITVYAVVTRDIGMYCDAIADGDSVRRLADFADDAAEPVADDGRATRSSYRVLLGGRELRVTVLVEIGATDPTGLDVDSDVCRSDVAQCDVTVDSDILFSVETCSFHL